MNPAMIAVVLGASVAAPLAAQSVPMPSERPWYVSVSRYGKWVSLAGAAGLVTAAAVFDSDARAADAALSGFCEPDPTQCQLVGSGNGQRYISATAESLYQEAARLKKKSRSFLIGGQFAIVSAGSMFLIDLLYGDKTPRNIPFPGLELHSTPRQLGLAVRF